LSHQTTEHRSPRKKKSAEKLREEVIYRQFSRTKGGEKKKEVFIPANRNKPYNSGLH